ncbi:MAG: YhjD/YihY/BrkB family envelope integrity protein [Pseudomonadota bacterium]|nr:YhjD/YihY/BrkB family envelope integrity protein [Pseudomonadota bacterium]
MFSNLLSWWNLTVWQADIASLPGWKRRLLLFLRGVQMLIADLMEGRSNLYAKGLVYTSILSLVPLLAVMFSVLKGFGVHNQLEPLLLQFFTPLGEKGVEITTTILTFVDNIKVGVLGAVGLGVLMLTVISLIQQIETAFNSTWRVRHLRPILERFSHYISVLLVGPVLIFSAIGLSQSVQHLSLFQVALETEAGAFLYKMLSVYLPFIMTVAAIAFVYMFVPNTRVKFSAALFGAIIASLLFKVATSVFTLFIAGSTKYDAIYSAFATIIILFIWIFIVWLILLLGSSIAYYYQHSEKFLFFYRDEELSPYESEALALQIMVIVTRRYYAEKPPIAIEKLSRQLQLPDDLVEDMVFQLEKGGYLKITDNDDQSLLPGRPPEETNSADLLAYIHDSKRQRTRRQGMKADQNIISVLMLAEKEALDAIQGISLKQLASSEGLHLSEKKKEK